MGTGPRLSIWFNVAVQGPRGAARSAAAKRSPATAGWAAPASRSLHIDGVVLHLVEAIKELPLKFRRRAKIVEVAGPA